MNSNNYSNFYECLEKEMDKYVNDFTYERLQQQMKVYEKFLKSVRKEYQLSDEEIRNIPFIADSRRSLLTDNQREQLKRILTIPGNIMYDLFRNMQDCFFDNITQNFISVRRSKIQVQGMGMIINHTDSFYQALANNRRYKTPFVVDKFTHPECSLCGDEFTENSFVHELSCRHAFHFHCLDIWLEKKTVCPFCQKQVILNVLTSAQLVETDKAKYNENNSEEIQALVTTEPIYIE